MTDAIKLAIDFLHCVDQRFDLAKEPHAPGVTMLDQFHAALAALRAQPAEKHTEGKWCVDLHCNKCYSADFRFRHKTAQPDHSELVKDMRSLIELWKDAPATAGFINRLRDALPPAIGETME